MGKVFELPAFRVLGDIRKLAALSGVGFSAVFQNLMFPERRDYRYREPSPQQISGGVPMGILEHAEIIVRAALRHDWAIAHRSIAEVVLMT